MLTLPLPVAARTLAEIQADIDAQQGNLNSVQGQLLAAEKTLALKQAELGGAQGEIQILQAQIAQIESQIAYNTLQIQVLSEQQKLKTLEREQREEQQDRAINSAYQDWRSGSKFSAFLLKNRQDNKLKQEMYQTVVRTQESKGIDQLVGELTGIEKELSDFTTNTLSLEQQNSDLVRQKAETEARIAALRNSVNAQGSAVAGLRGQANAISAAISQLSGEQRALENYEAFILGQSGNGGTNPLQSGQYYFTGKGRELYQGHGVGLSQFGAYGAANGGWNSSQILGFYYKDTHLEARPGTVNVQGYGVMDVNTYAAGQAEVPGRACGNAQQAAANPSKYVVDNPNTVWDCWPEEAIKAQIIAFRTYALNYNLYYGAICTTTACQVYNGGQYSNWAAQETKDLAVISHGYSDNGRPIQALYSSDNHNGWGTADNDTRFSSIQGDGTALSYLRAVNDSAFTYHTQWTDWAWRTNGYQIADFDSMVNFSITDPYLYDSSRSYMQQIKNTIGNVSSVNFERDPSGRVKKVQLTGTNGNTMPMAGWFFKIVWNSWIDTAQPTGQKDFIYSQTFYLLKY